MKTITLDYVLVCDNCLQASCWQGMFMCEESRYAGTVEKTIDELKILALEHPCWWDEKSYEDLAKSWIKAKKKLSAS